MRRLRSRGCTQLPSVVLLVGDSQVLNRRKRPSILQNLDTCISLSAFKSNPNYLAFFLDLFLVFFPSVCFRMAKIPHGDTSICSVTQARNQEPPPHPRDQLLNHLLPKWLSVLVFTPHPHKHCLNTIPVVSHCSTAVVFLSASLASNVLFLSGKNCQLLSFPFFSATLPCSPYSWV